MYLKEFLHEFEEQRAFRRVEDHLKSDADGKARAEFLGQFLSSVFQPIFEKHNQSLVTIGFEAFIRPVVNDKNFSPRHYFERLAEEDKSFADLICRDLHLSNFIGAAQKNEFISINIVPQALEEHVSSFEALSAQLMKASGALPTQNSVLVEIDITPELDAGVIYTFASQLKALGLGIALENFDCDCASFSRIVHCKPDVVKFNRSWLDTNLRNDRYIEMVSGVVQGLHSLGAIAHLERIETREELLFAIAAGFDRFQGFYLSNPDKDLKRSRKIIRF